LHPKGNTDGNLLPQIRQPSIDLLAPWLWAHYGINALFKALKNRDIKVFRELLKNDVVLQAADFNTVSEELGGGGHTMLSWACKTGCTDAVEALMALPAVDVLVRVGQETILHLAASEGREAVVRELLKDSRMQQAINATGGPDNMTSLHKASGRGHWAVVHELLQCPLIDINVLDSQGRTSLQLALHGEHNAVFLKLKQSSNLLSNVSFFLLQSTYQNLECPEPTYFFVYSHLFPTRFRP
jgi:ankyrin repeat protein